MTKTFTPTQTKNTTKTQGAKLEIARFSPSASIAAPSLRVITDNISTAGIREAAKVLDSSRIRSQMSRKDGLTEQHGTGGSTGNLPKEITSPGFDHGRASGGNVAENPKDKPGDGFMNLSQNDKDTAGALGGIAAGVATVAGVLAGIGLAPEILAAVAIGAAVSAATAVVLEKKGTPNPEDITGGTPGVTITGKGVGFDPITGLGPSRTEKLGHFTGDEVTGSGVILTPEEARNFRIALSGAQGSFLKDPSPLDESSSSGVLDDRTSQRIEMILAGGGAAGPMMNADFGFAGMQDMQQLAIATDVMLA